jgi:hypothetical protein
MRSWRDYVDLLREEHLSDSLVELACGGARVSLHRRDSVIAFMIVDSDCMVLHEGSSSVVGVSISETQRVIGGLLRANEDVDVREATSILRGEGAWLAVVDRTAPVTVRLLHEPAGITVSVWPPVPQPMAIRSSPIGWVRKRLPLKRAVTSYPKTR